MSSSTRNGKGPVFGLLLHSLTVIVNLHLHLLNVPCIPYSFRLELRPGGSVVFLTANLWDYGTLVAKLVPNRLHAKIIKKVEGREEEETFPTAYRTNTRTDVARLADSAKLQITSFEYLNQYPNYLMFNGFLFLMGVACERMTSRFDFLCLLRGWILATLKKPDMAKH